jgi:opacity protein-like surface antigen
MKLHPTVVFTLMFSPTAFSVTDGGGYTESRRVHSGYEEGVPRLGLKVGLANVEQLGDPVVSYGIYGDVPLSRNFLLGLGVDYWSKSSGTLASKSVEVSDLAGSMDAKYVFTDISDRLRPYALAGIAVHRFAIKESQKESGGQIDQLDSKYKDVSGEFGLDYGAGLMYQVQQSTEVTGEVRYRNIMDPGVSLSHLSFTAGLNFIL